MSPEDLTDHGGVRSEHFEERVSKLRSDELISMLTVQLEEGEASMREGHVPDEPETLF